MKDRIKFNKESTIVFLGVISTLAAALLFLSKGIKPDDPIFWSSLTPAIFGIAWYKISKQFKKWEKNIDFIRALTNFEDKHDPHHPSNN